MNVNKQGGKNKNSCLFKSRLDYFFRDLKKDYIYPP